MSFLKDSWEILPNTPSFSHLHWEPLVCGKEDTTLEFM
jgi:hypothetical protein